MSHENPYQVHVLQVTHTAFECAKKLKVHMIKSLSPYYQAIPEIYHSFVAVGMLDRWQLTLWYNFVL